MTADRVGLLFATLIGLIGDLHAAPPEIALQARAILTQHCADCHANGSAEGKIDFILQPSRLIRRRVIEPQSAVTSLLYRQVKTGQMPKAAEPLSATEVDILKRWIDLGAPDFNPPQAIRKFISPGDIVDRIARDLDQIQQGQVTDPLQKRPYGERDLKQIRYFTLTHLYNAEFSEDELETYRLALSKLVNSLSWGVRIVPPVPVDPERTILRIDLRHYKWTTATWERIVAVNPYGVTYETPAAKTCYSRCASALPYVRGDWFVAQAAVPPLYHDILEIPATDKLLEQRLQIDVAYNLATDQAIRAGFNGSGVSSNNRLLERHESDFTHGAYWKSYDFGPIRDINSGQEHEERNLFARPLGPKTAFTQISKVFTAGGGELIWNLPNGLQAYMLVDDQGKRIDKGPTEIVSDPGRADRAVINGLSCMSCHSRGMKLKRDQIREHVLANANAFTATEVELVRALYTPAAEWDRKLEEDAARFIRAVEETGGKVSDTDPVVVLAQRFDDEVDLPLAAAEAGVTPEVLLAALGKFPRLVGTYGPLKSPGQTIKRDVVLTGFGTLVADLRLGTYLKPTSIRRTPQEPGSTPPLPAGQAQPLTAPFIAAQAKAAQEAWAKSLGKAVTEKNSIGMDLVLIPPGKFRMGSPAGEADRGSDENQVDVTLTQAFWLAKTEVTQVQWQQVMGTTPWKGEEVGKEGSDYAATYVSWEDAEAFCTKLSQRDGKTYRLPREAEWEWSCRAGTTSRFSFGDSDGDLGRYAWFTGNADDIGEKYAHRVGLKLANPFGLSDMHGNVYEWCADLYADKLTGGTDPVVTSRGSNRVYRGGGWYSAPANCRSASRYGLSPGNRDRDLGFRPLAVQSR